MIRTRVLLIEIPRGRLKRKARTTVAIPIVTLNAGFCFLETGYARALISKPGFLNVWLAFMNLIMEELPCLTLDIPIPTHATPILVDHPIWGHRAPLTSSREAVPAQCGPGWSSLSSPSSWFSGWRSSITAPIGQTTSLAHPPPRDPHLPCRGPKLRQIPGVMHRSRRLPHPPRHRSRADERSCMTVPDAEAVASAFAFF